MLVTLFAPFGQFGTCPQNLSSVSELRDTWNTDSLTVTEFPSCPTAVQFATRDLHTTPLRICEFREDCHRQGRVSVMDIHTVTGTRVQ